MPESDRIKESGRFTVCNLADALGVSFPIETSFVAVDPKLSICGPAFTVECAPGDNLTVHHALHLAEPGDVLVISGSSNSDAALWGELMSLSARTKGLAGTIVDGSVRDPLEIALLEYPVFCRQYSPRRAAKETYGQINVPIRIGSLSIQPRDIVIADANGFAVVPQSHVNSAIESVSAVIRKEEQIKDQILSGRTLFEIFDLGRFVVGQQSAAAKPKIETSC